MERKAQELAVQYQKILEMVKYKGLCSSLLREYGWALVIQYEAELKKLEAKVAEVEKKIDDAEKEKKQVKENKEKIISSHEKEKSMLSELRRDLAILDSKHEKAHVIFREVSKENLGFGGRIKLLNEGRRKLKNELSELDRQMRDSLALQTNDDERIKAEAEQEKRRYQETIDQTSQELAALRARKSDLDEQENSFKLIEEEHKMTLTPLQIQLRK